MDDELTSRELSQNIQSKITLLHFKSIESTNQYAKQICRKTKIKQPFLIWADQQTAGVGKRSRPFFSSAGGLYISLILPNQKIEANNVGLFTTSLALGIIHAIQDSFAIIVDVKWVNDIYLEGRKIAGILVEQCNDQSVIIGVGINLFQPDFPTEIQNVAGNLLKSAPSDLQRQQFLVTLVKALFQSTRTYTNPKFIAEYKRRLTLMNPHVKLQIGRSEISEEVVDVNNLGQLIIENSITHEKRSVQAGEVIKVLP